METGPLKIGVTPTVETSCWPADCRQASPFSCYSLDLCLRGAKLETLRIPNLDDWLTVHRSITLVDLQLDAQNSYLFTYNTFIKFLYMFRALPCSSSGGLHRNCIYATSGIVTL
jgi:hypothetical protein